MAPKRLLMLYTGVAIIEGVLTLLILAGIPADTDNAWLLGFSQSRLLALLSVLLFVLGISTLMLKMWRDPSFSRKVYQQIENLLHIDKLTSILLASAVFGFSGGLYFLVRIPFITDALLKAYAVRFGPLVFLFTALSGQTALYTRFRNPEAWRQYSQTEAWTKLRGLFLISVIACTIWAPRAFALDRFLTPDERLWAIRSANFYYALKNRDYRISFQTGHPGVTTMWAGTAGILERFPDFVDNFDEKVKKGLYEKNLVKLGYSKMDLLTAGRSYMVLANTISLTLAFVYGRLLFGTLPAVVGFILIAFDPFHLAHTRLLHLDGLLSNFMLLSLLAILSFLQSDRWFDLAVSGIAAGLSWLTKSPGIFLIPIFSLLALIAFWRKLPLWKGGLFPRFTWQFTKIMLFWGLAGVLVFVLLWPAMWGDPFGTVSKIFEKALGYAVEGHSKVAYFNGAIYPDGEIGFFSWFYPFSYLWRTTPIVMLGLLGSLTAYIFKYKLFEDEKIRRLAVQITLFSFLFFVFTNLGTKKFDRYLLPVFPASDLVAGLGLVSIAQGFGAGLRRVRRVDFSDQYIIYFILGLFMLVQLAGSLQTYPYYLSYYNPIMGGSRKAPEVMMIGWGEGLDQAARYLNNKPESEKLNVISWYHQGSFSFLFSGESLEIPNQLEVNDEVLARLFDADYAVIYIHQWQRQSPRALLTRLKDQEPEYSVWINGLEYVRVYKLQ